MPSVQGRPERLVCCPFQQRALEDVHERADRELSDQPDEVGRKAAMGCASPDCGLIARQPGGQERAGSIVPVWMASLMWSAASPAPPSASASHRRSSVG